MKFILNKDTLIVESGEPVNSGSLAYYEAAVEYDESWNGLSVEAVLVKEDKNKGTSIAVIDNKMYVDQQLKGEYSIGFVGYKIEDEKKIYQISTNLKSIYFNKGAGEIETEEQKVPTPTEWEIYNAQIQEFIRQGQVVVEEAKTSGDYSKEQGTYAKEQGDYAKAEAEKVDEVVDYVVTTSEQAKEISKTAESIARGKSQAIVFETFEELEVWLKDEINKGIGIVGDNLYIKQVWIDEAQEIRQPDYWITEVLETPNELGYYYNISILGTDHPDLTNYVKDTDYATKEIAGVVKTGIHGIKIDSDGALYINMATTGEIDKKLNQYMPIVPKNLDYAVGSVFPLVTRAEYDKLVANGTVNESLYYCIKEE